MKISEEIIASDAIESSDILGEPRAVSGFDEYYAIPNTSGPHIILTKKIQCPADEYLIIFETGSAEVYYPPDDGISSISMFAYSTGAGKTVASAWHGISGAGIHRSTGGLSESGFIPLSIGSICFNFVFSVLDLTPPMTGSSKMPG